MPKRKSAPVAKSQPSPKDVPPPEAPSAPQPALIPSVPRVSDLFVVDNSEEEWKVARYLHDWYEIARSSPPPDRAMSDEHGFAGVPEAV